MRLNKHGLNQLITGKNGEHDNYIKNPDNDEPYPSHKYEDSFKGEECI
jgi:hypothetical protein